MNKRRKNVMKFASLVLIITVMLTMMSITAFADTPSDVTNHWAENVITEWIEGGIASGYPDGTFKPQNSITRAEFMSLANKAFGYTEVAEVIFTDVAPGAWYKNAIAIGKAAGYISGYPDGTIKPQATISRQEVAAIISKIKNLQGNPSAVDAFADAAMVPAWSKNAIGAVVAVEYMKGYPDDTFKPTNNITRAEALVALNKVIKEEVSLEEVPVEEAQVDVIVFDEAGTYGPASGKTTIEVDVIIKADGVTLQNYVIEGDLIIAEEVGKGTVTLNNITVEGETFVRGGGTDSIVINGGKFNKITVEKTSSGAVRIVASDIEGLQVVLAEAAAGEKIVLEGAFDKVVIQAKNIEIETKGATTIKEVEITSKATDAVLKIQEGTTVTKMAFEAVAKVENKGTIKESTGSQVSKSAIEGNKPEKITTPSAGGGGGGGGGSTTQEIAVSNINMIVDGKEAKMNLSDIDDSARVSGISFTVNADKSTLEITGVTSNGMVASTDKTVVFTSKNAKVTVSDLLGLPQDSVSLGTLRGAFGNKVTVHGKLSADGYTSYTTSMDFFLGGSPNQEVVNEWADIDKSENVITATIKSGKENTTLSSIGVATFLSNTFNQLPEEVKISGNWIAVVEGYNYDLIKTQLGALGGKDWDTVTLGDLQGKTVWFKTSEGTNYTQFTLNIR